MRSWLPRMLVFSTSLFLFAAETLAALTPAKTPLPNLDKRQDTSQIQSTPAAKASADRLRESVPGLKMDFDSIIGSPRIISATDGFLTGPGGSGGAISPASLSGFAADDPHRVTKAFLKEHAGLFGHGPEVLEQARITRNDVTAHNGMRTVVWEQQLEGIPLFQSTLISHTTDKDELISLSSRFVPSPEAAASHGTTNRAALLAAPDVSARQAVSLAAQNVGEELKAESVLPSGDVIAGAEKRQKFRAAEVVGEADAKLIWLPMDKDTMRLCWDVILTSRKRGEMFRLLVDARTGEVMVRQCLTQYLSNATYLVFTSDSPSPFSPGNFTPLTNQPPIVPRTNVTWAAFDTNASPLGWINDGVNETLGNNVDAHTDHNADNSPDLPRPQGSPFRVFNFPMDLSTQDPLAYSSAAVVQLFYLCNWYHDKLYELGFTEAAGNFQATNFNHGGLGNDAVQADAQDGSGTDNANFSTPPDGSPGRMQMYIFTGPKPRRDGDLDADVVLHEHTHGLSWRLVGGGQGLGTVQSDGMGEGWSDFYALSLLSEAGDDVNACYAAGGYASYQIGGPNDTKNYYFGIRRYPYTTDMTKNPLTFNDIDPAQADFCASSAPYHTEEFGPCDTISADEVHNEGEVWCVTLWDARANLINKYGWDVGNQLILQLVTDGMKLTPPEPNFLQARDAILQADVVDTGGANFNELWAAFAKRGMGFSATSPSSTRTAGLHEAFDAPLSSTGVLQTDVNPPSGSYLISSTSQPIFITVRDISNVKGALVTSSVIGVTNLTFRDDGQAPDLKTNDGVYSALFQVPATLGPLSMIVGVGATNGVIGLDMVNYSVVPLPLNDNFANAIKVPTNGATYTVNNRFATREPGEPRQAGVAGATASLWWSLTPSATTNYLLDTTGSAANPILAVYTGTVLSNLVQVAGLNDTGTKAARLRFDVSAGTLYYIAVASRNTNSTGSIKLAIAPGGVADTNPPTVAFSSPLSGLWVSNRIVSVAGTASDSGAVASGLRQVILNANGQAQFTAIGTTNWSSLVALKPGLNNIKITAQDLAGNVSSPVNLQLTYIAPPAAPNDLFANAIELTNASGSFSAITTNATTEFGEPAHAGGLPTHSVWYSYTPAVDGVLTLNTTNSNFDTVLALYAGASVTTLTEIASDDDAFPGAPGGYSLISQAVRAGVPYHIVVDGFGGVSGTAFLNYSFAPATVYRLTISNTFGGNVQATSLNNLGGVAVVPGTAGDFAQGAVVQLTATPRAFYQFDTWSGSVVSPANPLSIVMTGNETITGKFVLAPSTDGFETGNLLHLGWTFAGTNAPWFVQTNFVESGTYSARSGVITDSQSSSLILASTFHSGNGSFDYSVSSELNFDFVGFYMDGILIQEWSGDLPWATFLFPLVDGPHTLEWRYTKDASGSSGLDAAAIDRVILPIFVATNSSSAAKLQAARQADGTIFISLTGQTNQQYVFQTSSNLLNWQNFSTNILFNGFLRIPDPTGGSNQAQFFRAVVFP